MKIASEDNKMGIRGARTAEIVFEDCRVPKENMVGELNGGYRLALDVVDRGRKMCIRDSSRTGREAVGGRTE